MAIADTNVELLALDPDALAEKIATSLRGQAKPAGELTYTPTGRHSYYRDFLAVQGFGHSAGAQARLDRHASEMAHVATERRERAERLLRSGMFEFRVEPNRITGEGGYFAPPAWLNELFATAVRPRRVLAGLMPRFPLPAGVQSVNVPIIGTGTAVQETTDLTSVPDQNITDTAGSSAAVPFAGRADVALQLLEQSPAGAHLDWAIFMDLAEAYDAQLETQLIAGTGGTGTGAQLLGVTKVTGINSVPYTDGSPSGSAMYPFFGRAAAQVGDNRDVPPECFLMRTARWAWIQTSEDTATMPFGLYTPYYLGNTSDTPDPIGALASWPTFLTDAIPNTLGAGGAEDRVICLRPSDLILLEGEPQTAVDREPLSGGLGVRIQMHGYAAAITNRYPTGISVVSGTGMAKPTGF